MSSLVFINQIGPLEGNLFSALSRGMQSPIIYHIGENNFYPQNLIETNAWVDSKFSEPGHIIISRYFEELIESNGINRVIALGIDAISFANSVIDSRKIFPVISKGELNFSARRAGLLRNFIRTSKNSSGLFFDDAWEMDKASAHGSTSPHFLYPRFTQTDSAILNRSLERPRIALIQHEDKPDRDHDEKLDLYQQQLEAAGFDVKRIKSKDLYSRVDLTTGRTFPATMRYRIGDCSHALIIGDSRNSNSVMAGLSRDANYVYVEDTFNSSLFLDKSTFHNFGQGMSLIKRLINDVWSLNRSIDNSLNISLESPVEPMELDFSVNQPWFYEANPRILTEGSFDLYFTVSPIENRANGARPQRIRNMAESMYESHPTILLTSNGNLLGRKIAYVKWLIDQGYIPRVFYGENSTSPIANYNVIGMLISLFEILKAGQCRISWFVRDLHWLDPSIGENSERTPSHIATISRGLFELSSVAIFADILFAPNFESIKGFEDLIERKIPISAPWVPLPPGVSQSNIWEETDLPAANDKVDAVTIVYSGGISDVYNMDMFLDSIRLLDSEKYLFDFVTRKDDEEQLVSAVRDAGLDGHSNIRILHSDFHHYLPLTRRCIGVVLLNSSYARFSFPYKTMSMMEKGFPIITFSDMAIADFVMEERVGILCDRTVESIVQSIESLAASSFESFDFKSARVVHSWHMRTERVKALLA